MPYAYEICMCDQFIEVWLTQDKIAWEVITLPNTNRKS